MRSLDAGAAAGLIFVGLVALASFVAGCTVKAILG